MEYVIMYIYNTFIAIWYSRQGCLQNLGDRHMLALETIAGQNYQLT